MVHELGEHCVELLASAPIQGRSFAAVALAYLPMTGVWDDAWTEPFLVWWTGECDVRGYDSDLGWVHSVAHGADVVGELGLHTQIPVARLLAAVAERVLSTAPGTWRDQEDTRLALAVGQVLGRASRDDITTFVDTLRAGLEPLVGIEPLPDSLINATRTLSRLYVVADGSVPGVGELPLRAEIKAGCRQLLSLLEPWSQA